MTYAAPGRPERIGTVRLGGDPGYDSDDACDDAEEQIRWLSLPFSRLVLNPNTHCTAKDYMPMRADLELRLGVYAGGAEAAPFALDGVCRIGLLPGVAAERAESAERVRTAWYPSRIAYEATYSGVGARLTGVDFFAEPHAIVRSVSRSPSSADAIRFSGSLAGSLTVARDGSAVVVERPHHWEALLVAAIKTDGAWGGVSELAWTAGREWATDVRSDRAAFVYGFATKDEGRETALRRALNRLATPVDDALFETKSFWDRELRRVPAPERWGIRAVDAQGVTEERQRSRYYAAWAFLLSNVLPETPERGFPYRQVTVGKGSLWADGSPLCPSNCAWESLYEIQFLAPLDPETAWNALEGVLSLIDEDGWLEGECLPSQKARTLLLVYRAAPDADRLRRLYSAVRRYLLWREQNPYWLWEPGGPKKPEAPLDQKDISFVSQWMTDVDCAAVICRELKEAADEAMWSAKKTAMVERMRDWFFADGGVRAVYWADSGKREDNDLFTVDMLVHRLPPDMDEALTQYYLRLHDPGQELAGLSWSKYPNLVNAVFGLYDRGFVREANELTDAVLRHSLRVRDFYECERPGLFEPDGVNPSVFSACQTIGLTWLRNGMRYETGIPYTMEME